MDGLKKTVKILTKRSVYIHSLINGVDLRTRFQTSLTVDHSKYKRPYCWRLFKKNSFLSLSCFRFSSSFFFLFLSLSSLFFPSVFFFFVILFSFHPLFLISLVLLCLLFRFSFYFAFCTFLCLIFLSFVIFSFYFLYCETFSFFFLLF